MPDLFRVLDADGGLDVAPDLVEVLGRSGGEVKEARFVVAMERVLPELGDVLVRSVRSKRPEEGGQPGARPIATEFPEGPPPRLENTGEVGLELGRRRKGFRPVGGPVGAVPVAVSPEARVRELRLDAEEVGDVGGDLAVLVHDDVLEDHRHGRLAEEEIPGGTGDGMEHPDEGRAFV